MWFKRAFVSKSSANCVHVRARGALEVGGMGVHRGSWEVRETQAEDHWGQAASPAGEHPGVCAVWGSWRKNGSCSWDRGGLGLAVNIRSVFWAGEGGRTGRLSHLRSGVCQGALSLMLLSATALGFLASCPVCPSLCLTHRVPRVDFGVTATVP